MTELQAAVDDLLRHFGDQAFGPEKQKLIDRVRKALDDGRQPLPHDVERPYAPEVRIG